MVRVSRSVIEHRILPVVVADDPAAADRLAQALVDGGLPIAEVTYRTGAASAIIRAMAQRKDLLVGAGTIINAEQVDSAVASGAQFIVSPGVSLEVLERAAHHGVPAIPGVATATDLQAALAAGATTVKFFPAEVNGGTRAIRALSAPFPQVSFIPTGGVNAGNAAEYLRLPQVVAVGGSWMVPADLIAQLTSEPDAAAASGADAVSRPDAASAQSQITELVRQAVELIRSFNG